MSLGLLAHQIVSETSVAGERRHRGAELLSALEIGQRRLWVAVCDRDRAHTRLRQGTARVDLVGAGKEARCRLGIAHFERGNWIVRSA